jgi:hypothetical protein
MKKFFNMLDFFCSATNLDILCIGSVDKRCYELGHCVNFLAIKKGVGPQMLKSFFPCKRKSVHAKLKLKLAKTKYIYFI